MPTERPAPIAQTPVHRSGTGSETGHALIVQLLIGLIVVAVIAVPIVLVSFSKARKRGELVDEINQLITKSNTTKEAVKAAYKRIRQGSQPLPHAVSVMHSYDKEFVALHRRSYELRKRHGGDGKPVTVEELLAMRRDLEAYDGRISGHHERIARLMALTEEAESAVKLARFYQSALPVIRRHAPYEPNKTLLPQLAEATRQFGTGMNFAISGIQKYPQDMKGEETPMLIKAGVEQIERVAREVDDILRLLRGTEGIKLSEPAAGVNTLDAYIATVLKEGETRR